MLGFIYKINRTRTSLLGLTILFSGFSPGFFPPPAAWGAPAVNAADPRSPVPRAGEDNEVKPPPAWAPVFTPPREKSERAEAVMARASARTEVETILRKLAGKGDAVRQKRYRNLWENHQANDLIDAARELLDQGTLGEAQVAAGLLLAGGEVGIRALAHALARPNEGGDRVARAMQDLGPAAIPVVARAMESDEHAVERRCAWLLGRLGGPEAARRLGWLAANPSETVRSAAVEALGELSRADRADKLYAFASDPSPMVRLRVVEVYARDPGREGRELLARLAVDSDVRVRLAVARALGDQPARSQEVLAGLLEDSAPKVRKEAARRLALSGDATQRLHLLRHEDPIVRRAAFEALAGRDDVSPTLFAALADAPDRDIRRRALARIINADGKLSDKQEGASAFLRDADPETRALALDYLTKTGGHVDADIYSRVARTESPDVRKQTARRLLGRHDLEAAAILPDFAATADPELAQEIIDGLRTIPGAEALPTLVALGRSENPRIRAMALQGAKRLSVEITRPLLETYLEDDDAGLREKAAVALGQPGAVAAVPALGRRKDDAVPRVRIAAISALRAIGGDAAGHALSGYLGDPDPAIRLAALDGMGEAVTPKGFSLLADVSSLPDAALRQRSVNILRERLWDDRAKAARSLQAFLHDEDREILFAAIDAIGACAHPVALPTLTAFSDEEDVELRVAAVDALGRIRDNAAIKGLDAFADDQSTEVRRHVYRGYARLGGRLGHDRLIAGLRDREEEVRVQVIDTAADLHLGRAVPAILERLGQAGIREEQAIIHALGRIRSPEALVALIDLQTGGGVFQRLMANAALEEKAPSQAELMKAMFPSDEVEVEVKYTPPMLPL